TWHPKKIHVLHSPPEIADAVDHPTFKEKRASWHDDRVHAHRLVDCFGGISGSDHRWCEGRLNCDSSKASVSLPQTTPASPAPCRFRCRAVRPSNRRPASVCVTPQNCTPSSSTRSSPGGGRPMRRQPPRASCRSGHALHAHCFSSPSI